MSRKIALLLPDLRGGGAERVCLTLAQSFKALGHDVSFILFQAQGEFLEQVQGEFQVFDLETPKFRSGVGPIRRVMKVEKFDLVIANMWPVTTLAPLASLGVNSEILCVEHGLLGEQYKNTSLAHRAALRSTMAFTLRAAKGVGVSEGVAQDMAMLGFQKKSKVHVIHNPVPTPTPANGASLARVEALWGDHKGLRLLSVGALKSVKRQDRLIAALNAVPTDLDAKLMLVGDGECRSALEAQATSLGLSDRIIFAGFQSDLSAFYQKADIFVLSSEREGFGNVLVEAMACGLTPVSVDSPTGPSEILSSGQFGYLVSEEELPNGIIKAANAPFSEKLLRKRAEEFEPLKIAQSYLKLCDFDK